MKRRVVFARSQIPCRDHNEDEGDGRHEEAESDITGRFNARFAGWEAARVDAIDGAVAQDECEVAVDYTLAVAQYRQDDGDSHLQGSKIASAIVVKSDNDPEDTAP